MACDLGLLGFRGRDSVSDYYDHHAGRFVLSRPDDGKYGKPTKHMLDS